MSSGNNRAKKHLAWFIASSLIVLFGIAMILSISAPLRYADGREFIGAIFKNFLNVLPWGALAALAFWIIFMGIEWSMAKGSHAIIATIFLLLASAVLIPVLWIFGLILLSLLHAIFPGIWTNTDGFDILGF